jgi:hypothetical protein
VHELTLAISDAGNTRLPSLLEALRSNTLSLLACEWVDGGTAHALGLSDGSDAVLLRLGGNDAFIRGQRAVLDGVAPSRIIDPAVWSALSQLDQDASAVVRLSGSVSALPERLRRIQAAVTGGGATAALHSSVSRGIVRVIVRGEAEPLREMLCAAMPHEHRIVERMPRLWWSHEADPFRGGLAGRVRDAFDPQQLCNRRERADA